MVTAEVFPDEIRCDLAAAISRGRHLREGPVLNGKPHGGGTMIYPDGRRYTGPFLDGKPDGFGLMTYPDGHAKKVEWRKGQLIQKF